MTDLKLAVVKALQKVTLDTTVSEEELPENLILLSIPYDGRFDVPAGMAVVFITDNLNIAREVIDGYAGKLNVIFIGEDAGDIEEELYDFWHLSETPEQLRRRYIKLIRRIKLGFDADFYKHALLTTIDTVPDMLWFKRIDGIHMLVNDAFTKVVNKKRAEIIGRDHYYIWDVPKPEQGSGLAFDESEEQAISSGTTYICDEPVQTREGIKQFTTYKTPLYDRYGNIFGTVGVGHDVTNFSNLGIELSILVESLPFPMIIFTSDWRVVRMNSNFVELTGAYTQAQIDSFSYQAWKTEKLMPVTDREEHPEKNTATREYELTVGGETRRIILSEIEIRDYFDNISGYFVTVQDITYQRAYESSILEAAHTDILTGLYNRRYFYSLLTSMEGKPFTLLYMDLDRFKAVNDSFGHAAGDDVLTTTARLMKEFFPNSVCFRLGGDEFAVIDEENSAAELTFQSKLLEDAVYEAFKVYGQGTTISIGILETDGSTDDIDKIIRQGDIKMYEAKKLHHDKFSSDQHYSKRH